MWRTIRRFVAVAFIWISEWILARLGRPALGQQPSGGAHVLVYSRARGGREEGGAQIARRRLVAEPPVRGDQRRVHIRQVGVSALGTGEIAHGSAVIAGIRTGLRRR